MHLLDEEELAHVGKILRKGYVRVHKPEKPSVKDILLCVLFSLSTLLFSAMSIYCIYCMIIGWYIIITIPGFIICAALTGISIREIHLSIDQNMPTLGSKRFYVRSPPNFLPEPKAQAQPVPPSHQSSTTDVHNQSSRDCKSEEATSIFKSTSGDEVEKYSTFEGSVQFVKDPEMIRSVSQYAVYNVPNRDEVLVETLPQASSSSSRKRYFCHNFESEESLLEMKTLPYVESSMAEKEVEKVPNKGSSISLPAMKFKSGTDT